MPVEFQLNERCSERLRCKTSAYDELTKTGSFRYVDPEIRSAVTEWKAKKGLVERADQDALAYRVTAVDHLAGARVSCVLLDASGPELEPMSALRSD